MDLSMSTSRRLRTDTAALEAAATPGTAGLSTPVKSRNANASAHGTTADQQQQQKQQHQTHQKQQKQQQQQQTSTSSRRRQQQRLHLASLALHQHISRVLQPGGGVCSDMALAAFGRVYRLHKLVLVQAAFFHNLLAGQFNEAASPSAVTQLQFPDPNMSRPALEYCLATLYGAPPPLQLPTWANPRVDAPLGAAFPTPSTGQRTPEDTQCATPRFLLSLVATSSYLGLPSVTSLALTLILASLTPYTVSTYLRFASGLGIVPTSSALHPGAPATDELTQPLVGWSNLSSAAVSSPTSSGTPAPSASSRPTSPPIERTTTSASGSGRPALLFYGPSCNKIGEAAVCWLCRWGGDVLQWETRLAHALSDSAPTDLEDQGPFCASSPMAPSPAVPASPNKLLDHLPPLSARNTPLMTPEMSPAASGTMDSGANTPTANLGPESGSTSGSEESGSDELGPSNSSGVRRSRTDSDGSASKDTADGALRALGGRETPTFSEPFVPPADEKYAVGEQPNASSPFEPEPPMPVIWAYNPELGLPSSMVRHVVSSDSFFVKTEWARYTLACHMVEFRRWSKEVWSSQAPRAWQELSSPQLNVRIGTEDCPPEPSTPRSTRPRNSKTTDEVPTPKNHDASLPVDSEQDEDEAEYRELFAHGIYYTHMSFEELSLMADDVSSFTRDVYTPGDVLQRGLWSGMELRTQIESCAPAASEPPRVDQDEPTEANDLNLALPLDSFDEPNASLKLGALSLSRRAKEDKRFFPVPEDETVKLGDNLGSLLSTSQHVRDHLAQSNVDLDDVLADPISRDTGATGLAALRDLHALPLPSPSRTEPGQSAFGLTDRSQRGKDLSVRASTVKAQVQPAEPNPNSWRPTRDDDLKRDSEEGGMQIPPSLGEMWVPFEPMRIGVDFWGVDKLVERNRLYSPTWFYAGSLWNLYVVIVRKTKGVQLGIYLHRQNPLEPLPPTSAPPPQNDTPRLQAPSLDKLLSESLNVPESTSTTEDGPTLVPSPRPAMPYTDPRKAIRAFFSIHCPSPLGNALTRFSSGPDHFTVSQSWGWKSSSLLGTLCLPDGHLEGARADWANRFRCVCTVGLV